MRTAKVFSFKVKKHQQKTELLEKEVPLYKKRVITVDWNDPPCVHYGSARASGRMFPFPDRIQRVSVVLDDPVALLFLFDNTAWKNKTSLKLYFRSMRERDVFLDVYQSLPPSFEDLNVRGSVEIGNKKAASRRENEGVAKTETKTETTSTTSTTTSSSTSSSSSTTSTTPITSSTSSSSSSFLPENKVSVFVATWNMGNEAAPTDLSAWIKPGYDLYAIAAQETTLTRKQQVRVFVVLCCVVCFKAKNCVF
jgi:hypothetical protein